MPRTLTLLPLFVASLAFLSQVMVHNPIFSPSLINLTTLKQSFTSIVLSNGIRFFCHHHRHHHHHHHHHHHISICDDFAPDLPPADTDTDVFCVDQNGCCNFTTVQSAIDAIESFSQKRSILWINAGIYYLDSSFETDSIYFWSCAHQTILVSTSHPSFALKCEKVSVPITKPNIIFQGQGFETTAIAWNDTANSANGTFYSASFSVFSTNFIAKNISFINVAPIPNPGDLGGQAVAIRVGGDQAAFWGCGFFGAQDTLHDDSGRHYFKECFIQGTIDFIFGDGTSLYEDCRIISIAASMPPGASFINGVITAQGRPNGNENTGFAFVHCTIGGTGHIWLGRAWRPYSRVVFAYTSISDIISPEGWNDWNDPSRDQTIYYGEYKCTGPGANMTFRAPFVQKLNDTEAAPFLNTSFINGDDWLKPYSY